MKDLFKVIGISLAVITVIAMLPDIKRYIKISTM